MRRAHIAIIGIAFLFACAAALLTRAWLVPQSANPHFETAAPASRKSIVVAAYELKYGDKLDAKAVKLVSWASNVLPTGAFLSLEALFGGSKSRVVLSKIGENEPILAQ